MRKAAVLVIDVQSGLFDRDPGPFEAEAVIGRINAVTAWARDNGCPVVFIRHEAPDSPLARDTPGWELQQGLEVRDGDLFVGKTTPDSFLRTNLEEVLRGLQVERLIVCGYASEFCVDTTVRRAAALGYPVDLVADAHTTYDKDHAMGEWIRRHHNRTLPGITSFGVRIRAVPTAELIRGEQALR